jgi:hypothetical protein
VHFLLPVAKKLWRSSLQICDVFTAIQTDFARHAFSQAAPHVWINKRHSIFATQRHLNVSGLHYECTFTDWLQSITITTDHVSARSQDSPSRRHSRMLNNIFNSNDNYSAAVILSSTFRRICDAQLILKVLRSCEPKN